jgi:hypothetical protein
MGIELAVEKVYLKSDDGSVFILKVANDGTLSADKISI